MASVGREKKSALPRRVILSASRNFATMRSRHLRCRATRSTGEGKTHCRRYSRKIAVGGISSEIKTIPSRPTMVTVNP